MSSDACVMHLVLTMCYDTLLIPKSKQLYLNSVVTIGGGTGVARGARAPQLSAYRGLAALAPPNWSRK